MKPSKQQEVNASITHVEQWSGPLPSPDSLARYNNVLPDAAERIMSMAEKEMEHRHKKEMLAIEQEDKVAKKRWRLAFFSMLLGFLCVLVLTGLIGYALYIGSDSVALGTAIGAMAAVAGLFTYSKIRQGKNEE